MTVRGEGVLSLVSWVGHTDLRGLALENGNEVAHVVADEVHQGDLEAMRRATRGCGPVMALYRARSFEQSDLIWTYSPAIRPHFEGWLRQNGVHGVRVHECPLADPTDYREVYEAADKVLQEASRRARERRLRLCINLSPGTPTMAAVMVLLGSTVYPARLLQVRKDGTVSQVALPFELDLFVGDILKDPDRVLAATAYASPWQVEGFEQIVGESKAIRHAVRRAKKIALRDVNVLLTGESGVGKEVFARAIHKASRRRGKPFVPINCAGLPTSLFEAELFGYRKGAFTGADEDKPGAFDKANGGILFLDEVGTLPLDQQAKLLRALQPLPDAPPCQFRIRCVGDTAEHTVNVRVISATNQNLLEACSSGRFRNDLYYRLATVSLEIPPLRDRRTDIRLLAESFLNKLNVRFEEDEPGYEPKSFSVDALRFLRNHAWPGNVRELRNVITQAAVFSDSRVITRWAIEEAIGRQSSAENALLTLSLTEGFDLKQELDRIRKSYVEHAWRESGERNNEAAGLLGISPSTMTKYRKRYGIP